MLNACADFSARKCKEQLISQITADKRQELQNAINNICDKLSADSLQEIPHGTSIGEVLSKLRSEAHVEDQVQQKEVGLIYDWINRFVSYKLFLQ